MKKALLTSFAILIVHVFCHSAQAQDWPQRPVKIVVPFAPGGNTDSIARIIAQRLGEISGQQFVVENRAGGGGLIAAETVARAPADGYTLLIGSPSQITIAPATTKLAYDPVTDFTPITVVGTNPLVLVANPAIPANTAADFTDYSRRQSNKLSYGTAGPGSIAHLTMAMFLKRAGIEMTPVFYRGGAPALADVIAGHIASYCANLSEVLPHASSGSLRLLAVSSDKRAGKLPHVPTFIESGFPGFKVLTWNGLLAPAGTPKDVVARIGSEVTRTVNEPGIAERLAGNGVDPLGNTPAEFAAMIAADITMWAEAVKIAGVSEK